MTLSMPFAKVDREQRLVSGFATLDNVDRQGDVVKAEASHAAFSRFAGNIREMHQPIAAGRMVKFAEDEFYDSKTGKSYRGVFVTVRVSKGAEPTWQKVLDGTLTGFSIGGKINDSETQWNKDDGTNVRIVKDYDLNELSLVDVPANQYSTVLSIQKAADGSAIVKGMIADVNLKNVFWCNEDKVSKNSTSESAECSFCGNGMENIGWFEDGTDRDEKVKEIVTKFLNPQEDIAKASDTSEGGVENMTDTNDQGTPGPDNAEIREESDTSDSATPTADEVDELGTEEAPAEETEAAPVDEVEGGDTDLTKMIDDLKEAVETSLSKTETVTAEAVATVEGRLNEISKSFDEKASELEKKFDELSSSLTAIRESSDEVTKRLDSLEGETAIRKSGEVSSEGTITKSNTTDNVWNGAFLGADRL